MNKNKLETGNSRDALSLLSEAKVHYVQKKFELNLNRSKKNTKKQKLFQTIQEVEITIKSVEVLEENEDEGIYRIIMPYIEGIVGDEYGEYGTPKVAAKIKRGLDLLINSEMSSAEDRLIDGKIFEDKLDEILDSKNLGKHKKWIEKIKKRIDGNYMIPIGSCHGDLTLSNIIYSEGSLNLIDFLTGYIETPLQDIVKLRQDFEYKWSFRYSDEIKMTKSAIFLMHAKPKSIDIWNKVYRKELELINAISIARIAPYIADEKTDEWLIKISERI
jgi:tRNA A-37 threonylcarbamoyl transferase component Bud32